MKVEIVTGVPLPPDWTTFWKQAAQQGFRPKIATVGVHVLDVEVAATLLGYLGDVAPSFVGWRTTAVQGVAHEYGARRALVDAVRDAVQTREVEVWNAWFEANALADIVATNAEGMTLSGPSVPPTSFGPLESRIYVLSVTPNGPPVAGRPAIAAWLELGGIYAGRGSLSPADGAVRERTRPRNRRADRARIRYRAGLVGVP